MTIFSMVVAIITQYPMRVEVQVIPEPPIQPDLKSTKLQRIPESTKCRFDKEPRPPQSKRRMVLLGQLLIIRRQSTIERDDICMIADGAASIKKKTFCFEQACVKTRRNMKSGQIFPIRYGRNFYAVQQFRGSWNCGYLKIKAGRHMWLRGVPVFFQPAIDMRIVGVCPAETRIDKQRKRSILRYLGKNRTRCCS